MKEVWYSKNVLIDGADAETLVDGETVTLLNWGNVVVTKVTRYVTCFHSNTPKLINIKHTEMMLVKLYH